MIIDQRFSFSTHGLLGEGGVISDFDQEPLALRSEMSPTQQSVPDQYLLQESSGFDCDFSRYPFPSISNSLHISRPLRGHRLLQVPNVSFAPPKPAAPVAPEPPDALVVEGSGFLSSPTPTFSGSMRLNPYDDNPPPAVVEVELGLDIEEEGRRLRERGTLGMSVRLVRGVLWGLALAVEVGGISGGLGRVAWRWRCSGGTYNVR
ncbi:hypothetical protein FB446DRAFT_265382 [Lentinula raphanica]|nr:hypothetical protein FB446DRAFT_265382 [Lentinula raphanica]